MLSELFSSPSEQGVRPPLGVRPPAPPFGPVKLALRLGVVGAVLSWEKLAALRFGVTDAVLPWVKLALGFGVSDAVLAGTTEACSFKTLAMRIPVTLAAVRPMPRFFCRSKDRTEVMRVTGLLGAPVPEAPASQRVNRLTVVPRKGLKNKPPSKPPSSMLAREPTRARRDLSEKPVLAHAAVDKNLGTRR